MRNALKALGTAVAIVALCAPLILWPTEDPQLSLASSSGVTLTVPATVIVSTTLSPAQTTTTTTEPAPAPPPPTTTTTAPLTATVAIAGDVVVDAEVMASVRDQTTGGHDFSAILAPVTPYLAHADYTVACLEPRLAGPEYGYSDSPLLNAPRELAFALRAAGVDLVATANRHSLDFGLVGVKGTLDRLEDAGLAHVGTYRSAAERVRPRVVNVRGIRVAFLDYTDRVNRALPTVEETARHVGLLDVETVRQDVKTAQTWGADAVVVLLNYGEPLAAGPTEEQTTLTRQLLSLGADVIVGTRPAAQTIAHVVTYATSRISDKFVAYSLGDLVTGTVEERQGVGFILYLHLRKEGLRTSIAGVGYLPVYVQSTVVGEKAAFRVLPVIPGLDPETDLPLTDADRGRMIRVWEDMRALLYRPDENIVPFVAGRFSH